MVVETKKIVVVGAGPAGMMAAIRAAQLGGRVTLLERNSSVGKKLLLSGKGRCNLTNACELDLFLERFSGNGQFLRSAFHKFFNQDLMCFFEDRGLKLKVERQLRVFPVTDSSSSILEILIKELRKLKVKLVCDSSVKDIVIRDSAAQGVLLESGLVFPADKIILATGGLSFSFTGSDGSGIDIARKSGHRVTALRPGLVPLKIKQRYSKQLEGLTLKNICIKISDSKKDIISEVGELMWTGFGISGPLVLSLSTKIGDWLEKSKGLYLEIDLKPGLSREKLDNRLLRDFKANPKKNIQNVLKGLLPLRLAELFIEILKINPARLVSYITQEQRRKIVSLCKGLRLDISGLGQIENGMITHGGVSLKDIDPRTMESRIVKGLYLAGEMIDVDADTGGFNLQAAFSTGYLAGESAALS